MSEPITIVAGLPRSGTSMMMQMLAAGGMPVLTDHVRQPDDDNPKGYYEFEAVKGGNQAWVDQAAGKVVKMVYRLLYDLPSSHTYRVVFTRRNLHEVIESQEEMLRRNGKPSGDLNPQQLAEIYRRQLDDVTSWIRAQPNFDVLFVEYRDVLDSPEKVAVDLNRFLGGTLDVDAMLRVPDKSLYRQRH